MFQALPSLCKWFNRASALPPQTSQTPMSFSTTPDDVLFLFLEYSSYSSLSQLLELREKSPDWLSIVYVHADKCIDDLSVDCCNILNLNQDTSGFNVYLQDMIREYRATILQRRLEIPFSTIILFYHNHMTTMTTCLLEYVAATWPSSLHSESPFGSRYAVLEAKLLCYRSWCRRPGEAARIYTRILRLRVDEKEQEQWWRDEVRFRDAGLNRWLASRHDNIRDFF